MVERLPALLMTTRSGVKNFMCMALQKTQIDGAGVLRILRCERNQPIAQARRSEEVPAVSNGDQGIGNCSPVRPVRRLKAGHEHGRDVTADPMCAA